MVCYDASLVNGERDGLVLIFVSFGYYLFFLFGWFLGQACSTYNIAPWTGTLVPDPFHLLLRFSRLVLPSSTIAQAALEGFMIGV